ncbi:pentapeptide repeat-containing protein [Oceaniovalibus sp. ACAM 378]|uniref:pentapeptide repeat-containing protein n=1 Tax=Oceaniovalibus sp. ACAM 378 TaxID=2599923 RepID=UPI0011DA4009|nr:pentapeptide repeat-containing protein [Oceaniovalibus sp. ACAM 378]TYB86043.1 pentapeptide repeat-containing protein [Oceaniovalibus sp. ACAM 378]
MSWTFLRMRRFARYYFKIFANWSLSPFRKKPLFEITRIERMQATGNLGFPNRQIARIKHWRGVLFSETLIGQSVLLLALGLMIAIAWQRFGDGVALGDVMVEFWGLLFDILFIVVLLGVFQYRQQRRQDTARQHEIIEDLKRWNDEEAMHRIVGALRRLNGMGQTAVDLTGAALSDAKLKGYGVTSLRGSKLSGGGWADETLRESSFKNVDFSRLDLRDVVFGVDAWGFGFAKSGRYEDCNFWEADLQGSCFDATELHWTTPPPDTLEEVIAEEDDGRPIMARTHYASFNDTDLAHATFKKCQFHWADFREAYNIETADFAAATGLETCAFDSEELKQRIIAKAKVDEV